VEIELHFVANPIACLDANIGLPGYEADISRAIQRLYGQLAAVYANQLHGLSSDIPIIVPRGHRFTQLLGAHICYGDGNDYQHLRVDPASIMFLTLTGWPSSHSWAPFSAGDGTRAIEFPSLRTLSVTYTDGNAANGADMHRPDGRPWRLHFPALESLAVNCHLDVCPLLQYLKISTNSGVNNNLAAMKHPALVPTIVYVLLRLPALTKFSATGIAKESIMAEIGKYSEQYPHLSRIEYTFGR
ncbi:hypothetical protein H4R18_005500, partial [Coemansia javaensis]